ncbi:hypothetical protein AKJ65_05185 [candidate division MSBL1 archaeon SCGC-AAA259E19]|uniref:Uncharacterized protein n=1 Tax=candidate division MSBL1 archaeon SCGC-AAA259E19 TaxID=1698264 RepID=A0A133UIX9_9EURY|nr:hypothetical protein AKJ65_05185 [candidate division MSBL1 archaeon SCGC-AAA259E19]
MVELPGEDEIRGTERSRYFKDRYERTRKAFLWFGLFSLASFGYFYSQITSQLFSWTTLASGLLFIALSGSTLFLIYRSQKYRRKWKRLSGGGV